MLVSLLASVSVIPMTALVDMFQNGFEPSSDNLSAITPSGTLRSLAASIQSMKSFLHILYKHMTYLWSLEINKTSVLLLVPLFCTAGLNSLKPVFRLYCVMVPQIRICQGISQRLPWLFSALSVFSIEHSG